MSAHHPEPTSAPRRCAAARRVLAAGAVAVGLLALPVLPAPTAAAAATGPFDDVDLPARTDDDARLSPTLRDDLDSAEAAGRITPHGAGIATDPVEVVVESGDVAATRDAVEDGGGSVVEVVADLVKAQVPAGALDALAGAPGTRLVREPYRMVPGAVSEGVAGTGAAAWHTGGDSGAGVKVAVVDLGFAGYASRLGTELPASVETDFTRCSNAGTTDHGTAVAEIVHDMAPGSSLLLVCVEDDVDFVSALGTLAGKGVKVANGSIGLPLGGRGDGSGGPGSAAAAVAALRRQGVLYVASAGNYGQSHVHVNAVGDTDFDGGGDFVDISDDDVIEFVVAPGEDAFVSVKWDAWPTTTQDFDAYVTDIDGTCGVSFSDLPQVLGGIPPIELVEVHNCTTAFQVFGLAINRFSGSGTQRLDVFFDGAVAFVEDPTGSSLPEPATSPAVLTVGAHCVTGGAIEPYSSRGPTIDDRIKPDLLGPDGTSGSVYGSADGCQGGGFLGTSAASPHVAGAAALLLGENPALDVAELQQLLLDRAQDISPVGPDNLSGAGRLEVGPAGSAPAPVPQPFTSMAPVRLVDTRPGTPGAAETVFGAGGLGQPVPANTDLVLDVTGVGGVPADATAVVLNVTVTEPTASGWITVHPAANVPTASNLNFAPGQTVAVHVTATVGADGNVRLYNSHGRTHLVVDVAGWYGPSGGGTAGLIPLAAPARAFDSRPGTPGHAEGPFGESGRTAPLGPGQSVNLRLAGTGGVPADASAVVVNLTVTGPTASGWFTMYPTGAGLPNASSLNFVPGLTVANLVVMPVGTNGQVTLRNSHGSSHAVVDVIGYFRAGTGARYVALDPPTRDLDTRLGNGRHGPLGAGASHAIEVARYYGVPTRASAVLLSVTAVFPTAEGWLTVYPATASAPLASNLNTVVGRVVPNAVISAIGTNGYVRILNARGLTHVVSDLAGYFVAPAA